MRNVSKTPTAVIVAIYAELTGDVTKPRDPLLRQRAQLALENPDMVSDLRALNPGRPGDTFDVFWEALGKVLNEVSTI